MCNHGHGGVIATEHGEGLFILGCAQVSKVYSPRPDTVSNTLII
jgi:hypothetical protein